MSDLQRTDDWHNARLGKVTASGVIKVCKKLKSGGYSAEREKYMFELMLERLTNNPTDFFINQAMQWGIDSEPKAKEAYFIETMQNVEDVGFIDHPEINNFGASPDGLVGVDGLVEIKCPESYNHFATFSGATIQEAYIYQMTAQMMCTGRKWCDFVSFDDRFPANLQIKIIRVDLDPEIAKEIEFEVVKFNSELEIKLEQLKAA